MGSGPRMPHWGCDEPALFILIQQAYADERELRRQQRIDRWLARLMDVPAPTDHQEDKR